MTRRPEFLQQLLDSSETAILKLAPEASPSAAAAHKVFERCRKAEGKPGRKPPLRLPVCEENVPTALAQNQSTVATAMATIETHLHWYRRSTDVNGDTAFWNGHANAMIIGPDGLEDRDDVMIGTTLMAPGVTYVDHDHPPEEVYLSLTPGEWWNSNMPWTNPGAGGIIYNPPGIRHAMRAGTTPFWALWFLPL